MIKAFHSRSVAVIAFIFMLIMNTLANLLPLNGITTGEVSDRYFNLFAPAGFTFIIWALIYTLLIIHIVYQINIKNKISKDKEEVLENIRFYFSISSVANGFWILAWHYDKILLSLILIIGILICLIFIMFILKDLRVNKIEKLAIKIPFEVYFGWITIAVVANFVTYFTSIGLKIRGLSLEVGTAILITATLILVLLSYRKFKSITPNFVAIWAYVGILAKHLPSGQFKGLYGLVINTVGLALAAVIICIAYDILIGINKLKQIELKDYEDQ